MLKFTEQKHFRVDSYNKALKQFDSSNNELREVCTSSNWYFSCVLPNVLGNDYAWGKEIVITVIRE